MKLILKASVTHLGEPGEVVDVKNGYARNYLIPQGLAIPATDANLRAIEFEIGKLKAAAAEQRSQAQAEADKMSEVALRFERKVADPSVGSLYGSVSVLDLADGLAAAGFDVDRGEIHLEQPVKRLGNYEVEVTLAYGVHATVKFKVVGEEGEEAPAVPDELVASEEVVQETLEAVEEAQGGDESADEDFDADAGGDDEEEEPEEEEEIDLEDTV